ncbi:MAG: hypothetical protein N5P05_003499 [Chroococcopsis gigantea SAG 12.99]|jgi:Cu-processing system permease protein|nr:ABC transporter permease [Chlorogloea purpurea SAG 13.99]MDV3001893.1 hypothetical protein [Chroococcopsis gigantea SAG 12.99]
MDISLLRIWAIAANGFREVIRDRVLYFIGFFALLISAALRFLPQVSLGTHQKIFIDLALSAVAILGAIVAIFVGTGLINKEIEKRTVLVLIPKPLSKAEFILGKHFGLCGVLGVMLTAMTVIFFLLLTVSKYSYQPFPLVVAMIYLGLELALLTAVAMMFGVFTSSLLATLLSFGVYLIGHISKDMIQLGILSKNPTIELLTQNLYLILPDLERFNLRNEYAPYGLLPPGEVLLNNAVYGLIYTSLLLGITIVIFSRRQF